MKVIFPDGEKFELDESLSIQEKLDLVEEISEKFKKEIEIGWETTKIKSFLSQLTNYIVRHKEEKDKGKEDKMVLSSWKEAKMNGKRKDNTILFTYLSNEDKNTIGMEIDFDE